MRKNKLILSLLVIFWLASCAKKTIDDPLIIPPNFAVRPTIEEEKDTADSELEDDKDVKEIKDLLLE